MAEGVNARFRQRMSLSLEILANINYVLTQVEGEMTIRTHLHKLMGEEIAKLVRLCEEVRSEQSDV